MNVSVAVYYRIEGGEKKYKVVLCPLLCTLSSFHSTLLYPSQLHQALTNKMYFNLLALALASLTTLAVAGDTNSTGNAVVTNNCPYPVYLWSVGSSVGPKQVLTTTSLASKTRRTLSTRGSSSNNYTEPFRHDGTSGGIALKITRNDNGLYDSSPQLSFSYSLDRTSDDQKVWYDLADVFGDPFAGEAVAVKPQGGSDDGSGACEEICWPKGVAPTGGSQVKNCGAQGDVELELCAQGC